MRLLIAFLLLATNVAQGQNIYQQNGESYADIVPVQINILRTPTYISRVHVKTEPYNLGTSVSINYDLQYSTDSVNFKPLHSGNFSIPVNQNVTINQATNFIFNYIKDSLNYSFQWAQ